MPKLMTPSMRNLFVLACTFVALTAFTVLKSEMTSERPATVNKEVGGVMLFHYSAPTQAYESLGTYKIKAISNNTPELLLDKLVRKTKEMYPSVNAILISDNMEECEAIKFKE